MILTVNHVTIYRYDAPMRSAVQSLRLFPARHEGQRLIEWSVEVEGGIRGSSFRDGGGDRIEGWSVRGPLQEVRITARGRVETSDTAGILRGHYEISDPLVYLCDTAATACDENLRKLAADVAAGASGPLDLGHRLSARVSDEVAYMSGSTQSQTTAAEALAQGQGVCQDQAHALIAMARECDLPARYVSGYFYDQGGDLPPDDEASHAWAELWIDGYGWIGFDPANKCCPDARYIRLGSGLDAHDTAPIRGTAQGMGAETMDVSVALKSMQQ
ncbi:transglutaminase family protein [Rhodobacteraceae bacterium]|nr:transglutaminase family protein [Paracoccaceae bacterium]